MIAVVVSREDPASLTIRDALLAADDWEQRAPSGDWAAEHVLERDGGGDTAGDGAEDLVLAEFEEMHLGLDGVDERLADGLGATPDLVVFASRHSGETGPLLSAHFTGNWGAAEYGGEDRSLARPAPEALRRALRRLDAVAPDGFDVAMEATHHGPSELAAPSLYLELGSGPEQWEREDGAAAVAAAVLGLAGAAAPDGSDARRDAAPSRTVIAVGEPHYCPRATRVVLETDAAVGHVVPDWAVEDLVAADDGGAALLEEAVALSDADGALVAGDAEPSIDADALPVPVVTERQLRRRSGVPDDVADAALALLDGDSVHLTERAEASDGETGADGADGGDVAADDVAVFDGLRLVRTARRLDRDAATAALEAHALGYAEDDDGVVTGVAVAAGDRDALVDALAAVLDGAGYEVSVTPDRVVATRERFDPAAARSRGVPEGPLFGRLAGGETVEVDGETVRPEDVTSEERETFEV